MTTPPIGIRQLERARDVPATFLDGPLIERLRVERRVSVRTLQTAIGVGAGWFQSLITGANHETVSLRQVLRPADELAARVRRGGAAGQLTLQADSGFWSSPTTSAAGPPFPHRTREALVPMSTVDLSGRHPWVAEKFLALLSI